MNTWLTALDGVVVEAAKQAEMPVPVVTGSDGGAFNWLWREYLDGAEPRVTESRVGAQPDAFQESVVLEVTAAAWLDDRREVAWSQVMYARPVAISLLLAGAERIRSPILEGLVADLRGALVQAWQVAQKNAQRLGQLEERRDRAFAHLRERGLIDQ
jgi:hypothetical protein